MVASAMNERAAPTLGYGRDAARPPAVPEIRPRPPLSRSTPESEPRCNRR